MRPAPCALRPAPCALRPAPCALRPAPCLYGAAGTGAPAVRTPGAGRLSSDHTYTTSWRL
uniref:Uncharacterized protein n=1 Tax=Paracidobacterium acidisoli TaxID=2303751 RepID=A0A372IKZ2_9BACT